MPPRAGNADVPPLPKLRELCFVESCNTPSAWMPNFLHTIQSTPVLSLDLFHLATGSPLLKVKDLWDSIDRPLVLLWDVGIAWV